ncbi:hypothetical protein [Pseudonocardia asaccharolytica]|nr:hypothetical protein [Pseudonocardia asaccharolytica]
MTSNRSYENLRAGQQRYAVIEFCSNAEAAWAKIASRKYDWLGVKDSIFVFGRPPAGGMTGGGAMTIGTPGADGTPASADHVVEVRVPGGPGPSRLLHATADSARAEYRAMLEQLGEPDGASGLFRVSLITNGRGG